MTNNAATEQPLPTIDHAPMRPAVHVQDHMILQMGMGIGGNVIRDAVLRSKKAKEKYKLERAGLFTFNGRDALLDLYQELVDALVYLNQYEMETTMLGDDNPFPPFFHLQILSAAMLVREQLENQGDFE